MDAAVSPADGAAQLRRVPASDARRRASSAAANRPAHPARPYLSRHLVSSCGTLLLHPVEKVLDPSRSLEAANPLAAVTRWSMNAAATNGAARLTIGTDSSAAIA